MVLSISQKEQAGPSWQVQGWTLSRVLQYTQGKWLLQSNVFTVLKETLESI